MRASRSEHRVAGVTMATAKAVATSTTTSNLVSTAAHDTDGSVWRHGALVGKKAAPMCENLLIALYLTLKPLDLKPNLVSLKRSHTKFVRSPRRQNERGRPETVVHPGRGQEKVVPGHPGGLSYIIGTDISLSFASVGCCTTDPQYSDVRVWR